MACLVVVEGPATGAHFALSAHRLVEIGRDEQCTFQIIDPLVSRDHLRIRADGDGKHVAIDAGSANGVLINGVRMVGETALQNGDEITVGATQIVYSDTNYPDAQSAMIGVRPGRQYKASTVIRL
ncbi:MAG: FHA domain-containing protein [Anaerolineae bacterium]|nr:FHA domain-containing protein [Phycisphaerae bacterium]